MSDNLNLIVLYPCISGSFGSDAFWAYENWRMFGRLKVGACVADKNVLTTKIMRFNSRTI